jgi:hypothetical protein
MEESGFEIITDPDLGGPKIPEHYLVLTVSFNVAGSQSNLKTFSVPSER